jgi:lipid-binding SYLF domain-containing protein
MLKAKFQTHAIAGASIIAVAALAAGCATTPKTAADRQSLHSEAQGALEGMQAQDPALSQLLDQAAGYAVFPNVSKGGALVGGAYGRGVLYEGGEIVGYTELNQASIGAQLGGQSFSELILFRDRQALDRFKTGSIDVETQASAVLLQRGAATGARFGNQAVLVILAPKAGLMVDLTVAGQKFNYEPRG